MGGIGVLPLAKKRREASSKDDPAPATSIVSVRCSLEFRAWLDGLADHERISVSDLFDRAMTSYARDIGYKKIPPKR
jgi:hypothetical protein